MTPGTRRLLHRAMLLLALGTLIAAHGAILYYVSSHAPLSIAIGAVVLVAMKHFGLFGPLLAWFRRRRPPCAQ